MKSIKQTLTRSLLSALGAASVWLGLPLGAAAAYQKQPLNVYEETLKKATGLGGYEDVAASGPVVTAALLINWLLTLLGTVAIMLIVYAGVLWLLARGKEEDIKKAKDILAGSVTGLFVILASYSIVAYVFRNFVEITN